MNLFRLLQQAEYFEKLAQSDPYDSHLRNLVINTRLDANNFSFREVANVVLADLTALDRNEADAGITGANHALLDILNATTVPDPNAMLQAVQQAANAIQQGYAQDQSKQKIAKYLVRLTQLLINKYFAQHKTPDAISQPSNVSNNVPTESTFKFLADLYHTLRNNQPIDDEARNKWNAAKSFYVRRLNGLNSLSSLTPQQQQEKEVISYVMNKIV